jgi:hypothetical protein
MDRYRTCGGSATLQTGPAFAQPRRRGIANGETTTRLAGDLELPRQPGQTLRPHGPPNRDGTTPMDLVSRTPWEADDRSQSAGAAKPPAPPG